MLQTAAFSKHGHARVHYCRMFLFGLSGASCRRGHVHAMQHVVFNYRLRECSTRCHWLPDINQPAETFPVTSYPVFVTPLQLVPAMSAGSTRTRRHGFTLRVPIPVVRSRSRPETYDWSHLVPENVDTVVSRVWTVDGIPAGVVGVVADGSRGGHATGLRAGSGLGLPHQSVLVVVHRVVIHLGRFGRVVIHGDRGRGRRQRG